MKRILGLCSALLAQALFFALPHPALGSTPSPTVVVKVINAETGRPIANRRVEIHVDKTVRKGDPLPVEKIVAWADANGVVRKTLSHLAPGGEYEAWAATLEGISRPSKIHPTGDTRLEVWEVTAE